MGDITELLRKWREGSREAENELFTRVTPDLRRLARYLMKGERKGHSLQPHGVGRPDLFPDGRRLDRDWHNRQHFYAIASRAMRRYLIDHARGRPDAEFVALEGMKDFLPATSPKLNLAITVDRLLDACSWRFTPSGT